MPRRRRGSIGAMAGGTSGFAAAAAGRWEAVASAAATASGTMRSSSCAAVGGGGGARCGLAVGETVILLPLPSPCIRCFNRDEEGVSVK